MQAITGIFKSIELAAGGVMEIIYPNRCQICHTGLTGQEKYVCIACATDLPVIEQNGTEQSKLSHLFSGRSEIKNVFSLFSYRKGSRVSVLLQQLKYHGKQRMAHYYGEQLASRIDLSNVDLIVPVPLHPKRYRRRGYNQSELIALGISVHCGKPVDSTVLKRTSFAFSQTRATKYGRWDNVRQVFKLARPKLVAGKHVLLVDDVLTTGATIEACAGELLKAHECTVSVATLAARI